MTIQIQKFEQTGLGGATVCQRNIPHSTERSKRDAYSDNAMPASVLTYLACAPRLNPDGEVGVRRLKRPGYSDGSERRGGESLTTHTYVELATDA